MLTQSQDFDSITSISIIEDNRFLRTGYKEVLENEPDFTIVGAYESCEEAFKSEDFTATKVVLMDIELPGMSGIEGVKHIKKNFPNMIVIMTTIHDDDQNVFDSLCAGAAGYLVKLISTHQLIVAIHDGITGGSPMTPYIARKVISSFQKSSGKDVDYEELTEKEQTILGHLAEGKSYATIAKELKLSVDGVRYHLRHIYEKLHVKTRAEAVAKGLKDHLIPPLH